MDNLPSNSHMPAKREPAPSEKDRVEKVVTGEVVERKRPLGRRFLDTFGGGDARSALDFVLIEVLLPAAKDAIADATSQGVERIIFGEARSRSRRTPRYGPSTSGSGTYTRYSSPSAGTSYRAASESRDVSPRGRATHDFKEIVLQTRIEAEDVLDKLSELMERYQSATVQDLYNLVGITPRYTDSKWGWLELKNPQIQRIREGYLLDLPRPEPID